MEAGPTVIIVGESCFACKGKIPAGALKCTGCNSWQDWRRYLDFGSAVLALLVALVSVVSFAIPIVKSAVTPQDSHIGMTFQGVGDHALIFIATNSGIRAGGLGDATFSFQIPDSKVVARTYANRSFINAGEAIQSVMYLNSEDIIGRIQILDEATIAKASACIIEIDTMEFSETSSHIIRKVPDEKCQPFLSRLKQRKIDKDYIERPRAPVVPKDDDLK